MNPNIAPEGLALPGMRLALTAVFEDLRLRGSDAEGAGRQIHKQSPDLPPVEVWLGALEGCGLVVDFEIARSVKSAHDDDPGFATEVLRLHLDDKNSPVAALWMRAQRNLDRQLIRSATIQATTRTVRPSRL